MTRQKHRGTQLIDCTAWAVNGPSVSCGVIVRQLRNVGMTAVETAREMHRSIATQQPLPMGTPGRRTLAARSRQTQRSLNAQRLMLGRHRARIHGADALEADVQARVALFTPFCVAPVQRPVRGRVETAHSQRGAHTSGQRASGLKPDPAAQQADSLDKRDKGIQPNLWGTPGPHVHLRGEYPHRL